MTGLTRRRLVFSSVAAATSLVAVPAAWAQADAQLGQPIIELYAVLELAMRAGRAMSFTSRFDSLAPVIERVFDLEAILKASVGTRWDSFDQGTQERLSRAFRRFTIATYVANFDKYDGEKFVVLPGAREAGNDRIVRTEIIVDPGDNIRLDYVMRNFGAAWRVVDVLIDGSISRVAVQRSDFRTILANGDAEALISSLHRKISDLSDGALSS